MKNNQVLKIGKFGDHDLARLALRERLGSLLQFGRLSLKDGEAKPRYDVKGESGKGVITRADGSLVFETSLATLVENGQQVRLALVAYKRLLRERGILQFVRDNRDLQIIVNTLGGEVVVFGFDSRTKSRVQRFRLVRDIVLGDIGVTLTALPKKLSDAVELGKKVEANFLQQVEAAKKAGDATKVAQLEKLGAELGIYKLSAVRAPKAQAAPVKAEAKPGKKRRRNRKPKASANAQATANAQPVAPAVAAEATSAPASETSETPKKKRRRRGRRNRKGATVQAVSTESTDAVVEPAVVEATAEPVTVETTATVAETNAEDATPSESEQPAVTQG